MKKYDSDEYYADLIDDAADIIERDGWIQGEFHKRPDPHYYYGEPVGHCTVGSFNKAVQERMRIGLNSEESFYSKQPSRAILATERVKRMLKEFSLTLGRDEDEVVEWNDNDLGPHDLQIVLDRMRMTSKRLRGGPIQENLAE